MIKKLKKNILRAKDSSCMTKEKDLEKIMRSDPNSVFNTDDTQGIKHNFQDSVNLICS